MRTETWLAWLLTGMAIALSTRNPLYLAIILLANAAAARSALGLQRLALIIPLATAFNALTVHIGDTVLARLPEEWPLIGGTVSLEAAVYGALNGAVLVTVITLFGTFSRTVEPYELIRLLPRAFHPVGLVVAIALNVVPMTARRVDEIREALTIRGIELRGVRDWLPLWVPLLAGGLENAGRMADALMARGYGDEPGTGTAPQIALIAGLAAILGGWVARFADPVSGIGTGLMVAGVVTGGAGMWLAGRSRERPLRLGRPAGVLDAACIAAFAAAALIALAPVPGALEAAQATLIYVPYPRLGLPEFSPLIGLALLSLALPAAREPGRA